MTNFEKQLRKVVFIRVGDSIEIRHESLCYKEFSRFE